jgi:hypothetical protein
VQYTERLAILLQPLRGRIVQPNKSVARAVALGGVRVVIAERVEPRFLLSAAFGSETSKNAASLPTLSLPAGWEATPDLQSVALGSNGLSSPSSSDLTLAQMRGAYGLGQDGASAVTFKGAQADGTGQTIVIVDAYDDPNVGAMTKSCGWLPGNSSGFSDPVDEHDAVDYFL